MQTWSAIAADVQQNWLLYASMPFVAATIGYVTKLVAIRMMFEPLEFVGVRPWFGWQGIIPRKAAKMAGIACDTLTRDLLRAEEIIGRLDPQEVVKRIEAPLNAVIEDISREVAHEYAPGLWEAAPDALRRLLVQRIRDEAPAYVEQMMQSIRSDIDSVFDLKAMLVANLLRDKRLLNRMFRQIGGPEFRFIARSGIWFGFIIGCVQAVTWALTHNVWIMPLFGGFTGWFTDWLALKMVFRPVDRTRYLGLVSWQGLFHRRRMEVAQQYGELLVQELVTPRNMMDAVLRGPASDQLYEMVLRHVQQMIDAQAGLAKPLVVLAVGGSRYQEMKVAVAKRLMLRLPDTLMHAERYAEDAMDLRRTLVEKMQQLGKEEFEGLLRPAFKEDEWILIAVGAALGFLVGEMQVFIMTH